MSELILTEEEKKQLSLTDWDDASLGKACKMIACILNKKNTVDEHGKLSTKLMGAVAFIVDVMSQAQPLYKENPDDKIISTIKVEGLTSNGKLLGNWLVTVEKTDD